MLPKVSKDIRECYQHAEECRRWADEADTPEGRIDFLDMQAKWLSLARGYVFAERLARLRAEKHGKRGRSGK
jgi:hypothetical protein